MLRSAKKQTEPESLTSNPAYRKVIAALAESEERYRTLVEGVRRYAIYMLDANGTIQTWNKGIYELHGYSREETIGHSGSICFAPEDQAAGIFEKELAEATQSGESNEDRSAAHKDGSRFPVNDIVTALRTSAGALIGFGKVTRKLRPSESQKQADAALSKTEAQLTRALALLHVEVEHRRKLEASLLTAVEEERQRLGQDLHDDLCQHLGGLALIAHNLANRLEKKTPDESEAVHELSRLIEDAIAVARNVSRGLHPVTLVSQGLPAALGELAERVPLDVEFNWPKSKRLDLEASAAVHLYRIAEEAVANAIRHSGGKKITIKLTDFPDGNLSLSISDDGKGFDEEAASGGMGLRNMKYRAGVLGGSLAIEAQANKGTCVRCMVPPRSPQTPR